MEISAIRPRLTGGKARIAALATTAALAGGVVLPAAAPSGAAAMKFQGSQACWVMKMALSANEIRGVIDADLIADYTALCWR